MNDKLWTPSITFEDVYEIKILDVYLVAYPNGVVYYEVLGNAELQCIYDFTWMPFDW
jgi:hypothetical protein